MRKFKQEVAECKKVCDKYEKNFRNFSLLSNHGGEFYKIFVDDVVTMAFLIASADGNVQPQEVRLINESFKINASYDMFVRKYGKENVANKVFLSNIPSCISKLALKEKDLYRGNKCVLKDTRVLYDFFSEFGDEMINCGTDVYNFKAGLLRNFTQKMLRYITEVESRDAYTEEDWTMLRGLGTIGGMENEDNYSQDTPAPSTGKIQGRKIISSPNLTLKSSTSVFGQGLYGEWNDDKDKVEEVKTEEDNIDSILDEVDSMIGLDEIKDEIHSIVDFLLMRKMRMEKGLRVPDISFHYVFTGNPGTGKTTIARMIARIYKSIGILESGQLVETDRLGLVASQVGKTAEKTMETCQSALGGVLFIDEAYSLSEGKDASDFGKEAINTLLKFMEDNRDKVSIIVAGYPNEMERFLNTNPGLKSRFNSTINFKDYSNEELLAIFKLNCKEQEYVMDEGLDEELLKKFEEIREKDGANFGNARSIRNYFEEIVRKQAKRVMAQSRSLGLSDNMDALVTITKEDL